VVLGLLVAALLQWRRGTYAIAQSYTCTVNMKSLWHALARYAVAHDGRLPSAAGERWAVQAESFLKNRAVLKCPCDTGRSLTSYVLPPEIAGKPLSAVQNRVVLLEKLAGHPDGAHGCLGRGLIIAIGEHTDGRSHR